MAPASSRVARWVHVEVGKMAAEAEDKGDADLKVSLTDPVDTPVSLEAAEDPQTLQCILYNHRCPKYSVLTTRRIVPLSLYSPLKKCDE